MGNVENMTKEKKPLALRLLGTISTFVLLGSIIYILILGIDLTSGLILLSAIGGISGPVILSGSSESILEIITGIFEVLIEGITGVFEIIGDIFGSIFG